ncbi:isocitrate/isopropylmalate dehydrogenase family protein [candidate division WOR-3 bacterium]|uniref:Isocitrate/isopropylmalate dehydrogenase family protein n=1 Tax=candidate division WOR-3 bacterium TaxID=2052148 RepID=A0A660SI69_UNCW3|nr:MAG: isocitrate/isopropylmalate dehydrogenase family protein [candidate division WOR-3 bacterium]
MARYRIAWLPGDGIGKDVLDAARVVLDATGIEFEYLPGDVGWEFWKKEGNALPERTVEMMKRTDACMFGAITSKPQDEAVKELNPELRDKGYRYYSPIVKLRQIFDLYTCLRPCRSYPGNPLNFRDDIDIVIFRENTEDLYSGVEFRPVPKAFYQVPGMEKVPKDAAISLKVNSPRGCERIIRSAFEYARKKQRKRVTTVLKANVVRVSDGLFLEIARKIAKEYPEIEYDNANIDTLCMWLIKRPHEYDVLVAPNLYGDIISDLCAQLVGGLGFACSANIGENYGLFEPAHGSAPKYAGMYKVNPIATILAAKLMLDYLGEEEVADRVEQAVARVLKEGKVRTYDLGGNASTLDMAKEVARYL